MSRIDFESLVVELSDSPALVNYAEAYLRDAPEEDQVALIEAADESDFPLRQWVASLVIVSQWLEVRSLRLALADKIGYVSCAAESAGAGANLTHLPSLVEEMLNTYGCERAKKKE